MKFDHVLFIGFGAPEKPADVLPFIEQVTRGLEIPPERLQKVIRQYEQIGGVSPYNRCTFQLLDKIREILAGKNIPIPFFVGMKNWHPFLIDTAAEIKKKNLKKGIAVVLAPHRSEASFEKYKTALGEALQQNAAKIEYEFIKPWHDHPGFVQAQAAQLRRVLDTLTSADLDRTHFLFTAHSIPQDMAARSEYEKEIRISSARVAETLDFRDWSIAYQSRSGNPVQPWLEPDVCAAIAELPEKGVSTVIVIPIGFICDNAEVLYDLDIQARAQAEKSGIRYLRASTVMDHPAFVALFVQLIQSRLL